MKSKNRHPGVAEFVATVLAWLVPGLGHIYLGRRVRGIIIMVTMTAAFWTGIAMGGVMTVDYRTERWWFAADMVTGIHGLVSWQRSEQVNREIDGMLMRDDDFLRDTQSARMNVIRLRNATSDDDVKQRDAALVDLEQKRNTYATEILAGRGLALVAPEDNAARAFCGIMGFLNLMCIFDAFMLARMGVRGEETDEVVVVEDAA